MKRVFFPTLFTLAITYFFVFNPQEVVAHCDPPHSCIDTALGRIPTGDVNEFAAWVLQWALGIGGGIAFLLIIWGTFQILTSSGNPDQVKGGREIITAAIVGLLLLIFSVFILRLITLDILRIPDF